MFKELFRQFCKLVSDWTSHSSHWNNPDFLFSGDHPLKKRGMWLKYKVCYKKDYLFALKTILIHRLLSAKESTKVTFGTMRVELIYILCHQKNVLVIQIAFVNFCFVMFFIWPHIFLCMVLFMIKFKTTIQY